MEQQTFGNGAPIAPGVQALMARPFGSASIDWRQALPVLRGSVVTLRELRLSDAAALWSMLASTEVSRFICRRRRRSKGSSGSSRWTHRERAAGNYACFAVVPHGMDSRSGSSSCASSSAFDTAEWGFAIGSDFWGTGVFVDGAAMVIDFAFDAIGAHRLEARAAVPNGRGNGALRKMGATREAILEGSLEKDGQRLDQALWTIRGSRLAPRAPRPARRRFALTGRQSCAASPPGQRAAGPLGASSPRVGAVRPDAGRKAVR